VTVCETTGDRRDRCADRTQHTKAAGDPGTETEVRRAEEEDKRGPEGAEGGEAEAADCGGFNKERLGSDEGPEGTEGGTVRHRRAGRQEGQRAAKKKCERNGDARGDKEDGAPVEPFADPAGEAAAEQDAEQEAGHDGANGAACVRRRSDLRRDGQQDVSDGGQGAGQEGDEHHRQQSGNDGGDEHGQDESGDHFEDETAALEDIAEGHEEEEADGVARLSGDRDVTHPGLGDVEAASHLNEQRLVEVEGRNRDARGEAEQRNEALTG